VSGVGTARGTADSADMGRRFFTLGGTGDINVLDAAHGEKILSPGRYWSDAQVEAALCGDSRLRPLSPRNWFLSTGRRLDAGKSLLRLSCSVARELAWAAKKVVGRPSANRLASSETIGGKNRS